MSSDCLTRPCSSAFQSRYAYSHCDSLLTGPELHGIPVYPLGSNPAPIDVKSQELSENRLSNIPVAVVASNHPHYLYRAIRSILSAHGAKKELITVFIDGFFEEPAAVSRLFNIKIIQHVPISSKNARISQVWYILSLVELVHFCWLTCWVVISKTLTSFRFSCPAVLS